MKSRRAAWMTPQRRGLRGEDVCLAAIAFVLVWVGLWNDLVPTAPPWCSCTIDPTRASRAEWALLPGVGPKLAARLAAAAESGEDLGEPRALDAVKGIGPAMMERLRPFVCREEYAR